MPGSDSGARRPLIRLVPAPDEPPPTVVQRYFEELWRLGDLPVADEIFAADVVLRALGGSLHGIGAVKECVAMFRAAFPDLDVLHQPERVTGETIVELFTMHGTHHGEFQGIAATGRPVVFKGVATFRVGGSRIEDVSIAFDLGDLLRQLGAGP